MPPDHHASPCPPVETGDPPAPAPSRADRADPISDPALEALLPVLAPALGACVLMQSAWDLVMNGAQDGNSLLLRLALLGAGAPAYVGTRLPWTPLQRAALVYFTHAAALLVNAVSATHGLVEALPVMLAFMLLAGLIEGSPMRCFLILAAPCLLYGAVAAGALRWDAWCATTAISTVILALALGVASVNGRLRRRAWLREQALLYACRHDGLSGALSRAYATELAEHHFALARRYGRPLAVAMIDIDHFKRINDAYGHAVGDDVIRTLVRTCERNVRTSDSVARVGGEEFVILMPETSPGDALSCAERIRTAFGALRLDGGAQRFGATVSIGVATLAHHAGWAALLHDADSALYRAKNGGRDRTVVARPDESDRSRQA